MSFDVGGLDDVVKITLGSDVFTITEGYHVRASVFEQPEGWSVTAGWGDVVAELMKKYPPRTPFKLTIGGHLTQSGLSDGYEVSTENGASEVTFEGRDVIAFLYDDHVAHEKSYANSTYSDLVRAQLLEAGLDPGLLVTSATSDRQVRAGVPLVELAPPAVVDEILTAPDGSDTTATVEQAIKTHVGERRLHFLRRYLDRAGFTIRASNDGKVILSAPNPAQKPVARIVRRRGDRPGAGNIEGARYRNNTRGRYADCTVYGRVGHGKHGRVKAKGGFADPAANTPFSAGGDVLTPLPNALVIRDANVQSNRQAQFLAARKLAEGRRSGWVLQYRMSGHTTPALGTKDRCVWTPDTIVRIDDDEYDLHGDFYLDSCDYTRAPQTETLLRFMRPSDAALILGPDE